jgi:hypothetical protein
VVPRYSVRSRIARQQRMHSARPHSCSVRRPTGRCASRVGKPQDYVASSSAGNITSPTTSSASSSLPASLSSSDDFEIGSNQIVALRRKSRDMKRRKPIVIPGDGDPCPRCGVPMQIREPDGIGDRQRRQRVFYTRWFCGMNKQCKTTLVMPARYKVANVG